jgi:hypothetical protein
MLKVTKITWIKEHLFHLQFNNGSEKVLDLAEQLGRAVNAGLVNRYDLSLVALDGVGGISWPGGFDLCPEMLYSLEEVSGITKKLAG